MASSNILGAPIQIFIHGYLRAYHVIMLAFVDNTCNWVHDFVAIGA